MAATATGEGETTRQKRKKKPKTKHVELGVAPSQSPHASKPPLPEPQSPAPGTPILDEAAMTKRKMPEEHKVGALPPSQNPTLEEEEEQGEEAVPATNKKHKERKSSPSLSTAETPILGQQAKVTKKRKPSKEQETSGNTPLPLHPAQTQSQGTKAPHASKPLPAAPFLEAPAKSPSPRTSMLEETATMRKRKVRKELKVAALPLAQNPTLEQAEESALATKKKKKHRECNSSTSPSAAITAETPILEQEAKVTKKRKICKEQEPSDYSALPLDSGQTQPQGTNAHHASKPLSTAPFIEAPVQSPSPGTPVLEEAAGAVMRKRKISKEQKVAALSLAQNTTLEEQREDAMAEKMMMKESNHMEHTLSSLSTSIAAKITICEQEAKVTKKKKQRKQREPSGKSPLPLDPGQAHCVRSQGDKAPPEQEREADGRASSSIKENNGKRPRVRVLSKRELIKEASKKQPALPEGFVPFSAFVSSSTEQNPDNSSPYSAFFDQFRYNPVRGDHKLPFPRTPDRLARLPPQDHLSFESSQLTANEITRASKYNTSVVSKTRQLDSGSGSQEKLNVVTKKRKPNKEQETSGNTPLPLHPAQTQSQGTKAPLASKPLPAAPFLEAPVKSSSPGTSMLEETAAMRKRKVRKEQKVAALPLSQNPTLEEQAEESALATKKKKKKHRERKSSPCPSAASTAETPILEQEAKVTKKRKIYKEQEPSDYSTLPLDSGQTQPQGTNAHHASKPLSTAPFIEAPVQSPAPGTPVLEEAAGAVMRKRKISKEQKVAALSLAQNTTLEEQREDAMAAKMMMESKHMEHTLSSLSTSVAAKITICEQEAKVTKKKKQRKQREPSGKSPLPLDPGQAHCVRSQGDKARPEQEREADGRASSSIKENNGKRPRVRVLSKRELIKEAGTKQPVLPEGFVPFSAFVSSSTEQNPDNSSPYSAFFDQFRYNPVRGDHKLPFPRTPDRLARLPPQDHLSFESSQLTANEITRASKYNISVVSKTRQLDSGSGSQEKLNVEVKENPQKKTRQKKQRKPPGNSLTFDSSQTCCVQLQGTKAPPGQYQETDALKVDNIKNGNGKKARVRAPSKHDLEMSKGQMLSEGFLAPNDFVPNYTEQNPNNSSPSGASFDQLCYRSACQDCNTQPETTDLLSMQPPRGYPSLELSELSVNGTSKTSKANNSVARKSKKKDSGSGSASGSQEKLHAKEKKNPEEMKTKKQRKPPPLLTSAEKFSNKYMRVPLDQLVPPPLSPHNLLQEKYASDPWKVIVICMLLNLTQGKQVKNIIEGFFECYPDAQCAYNADPDKMAGYLACLGLQHVKTARIQSFSRQYVEEDWTYITELSGVGKYAADAYAIFCAGKATEVVPKDHKLVDYWKYVCFELPVMQKLQKVQEAGVPEQELAVMC